MLQATFRPIERPVALPRQYARCGFGAKWSTTLDTLERELGHLKAKDIIVEVALDHNDIRNDGWPRSSASPRTPGVRVSFQSKHGPLSYECATYKEWEQNMRAIALTLERLRAVERYGAVKGGEQYKGWAQLPPGTGTITPPAPSEWRSVEDAMRFLCRTAGVVEGGDTAQLDQVYRQASRRTHPDLGGSTKESSRVNAARDFIEKHGGRQ